MERQRWKHRPDQLQQTGFLERLRADQLRHTGPQPGVAIRTLRSIYWTIENFKQTRNLRKEEEEKRKEEENRLRKQQREHAIEQSLAPELLRELTDILGKNSGSDLGMRYVLLEDEESNPQYKGSRLTGHKPKAIEVVGREDGSLFIGSMLIHSQNTRDRSQVENALEFAYKHPGRVFIPFCASEKPINTDGSDSW